MKLGYDLTIEQKQQLSMTPELIQAIKILQMENMDLFDYVQNELMENPMLEEDHENQEGVHQGPVELDGSVTLEIREKMAEDEYSDRYYRQWEHDPSKENYSFEAYTSEAQTLTDFLLEQLSISGLKGPEEERCRLLIEAIDENGYIALTEDEIRILTGLEDEEDIENILSYIHRMEPTGVGARDLGECLEIQLAAKGLLSEEATVIIRDMLSDVADNRIGKISKAVGIKAEEVQDIVDMIKTLEPRPGRQFAGKGESTRYVIPDIIVEKVDGDYVITSNDSSLPRLIVSSYYRQLITEADRDEELDKYISSHFNSAMWLIKSIEQRKQTIASVAAAIVHEQEDFFEKGEKFLHTLTLHQVADKLGIHESTVSRAINGKYMQSPRGVYELKFFFSSGVSASGEENGLSSNSVKSMIKEMIAEEDPKKPLSDQEMVSRLEKDGIEISRRTVAKYRESMSILSSSKRRRY